VNNTVVTNYCLHTVTVGTVEFCGICVSSLFVALGAKDLCRTSGLPADTHCALLPALRD